MSLKKLALVALCTAVVAGCGERITNKVLLADVNNDGNPDSVHVINNELLPWDCTGDGIAPDSIPNGIWYRNPNTGQTCGTDAQDMRGIVTQGGKPLRNAPYIKPINIIHTRDGRTVINYESVQPTNGAFEFYQSQALVIGSDGNPIEVLGNPLYWIDGPDSSQRLTSQELNKTGGKK